MSTNVHHHDVANLISSLGGPSLNLDLLLSCLVDQLCESTALFGKGIDEHEDDEKCKRHARAVTLKP